MQGYIHVYTGNGKGKTTAALGVIMRQIGAGNKIFLGQFLKKGNYSEIELLKLFPEQATVEQYGLGRFVKGKPSEEDIKAAKEGFTRLKDILKRGEYNLVVIDEGVIALHFNIVTESDIINLCDIKADHVELIITGRGTTKALIERADLVTEMVEIKHYYKEGVMARKGIEK